MKVKFYLEEKAFYLFLLIHEKLKHLRAKSLLPYEAGVGLLRNVRHPKGVKAGVSLRFGFWPAN